MTSLSRFWFPHLSLIKQIRLGVQSYVTEHNCLRNLVKTPTKNLCFVAPNAFLAVYPEQDGRLTPACLKYRSEPDVQYDK